LNLAAVPGSFRSFVAFLENEYKICEQSEAAVLEQQAGRAADDSPQVERVGIPGCDSDSYSFSRRAAKERKEPGTAPHIQKKDQAPDNRLHQRSLSAFRKAVGEAERH
jgi:hypothetical protein